MTNDRRIISTVIAISIKVFENEIEESSIDEKPPRKTDYTFHQILTYQKESVF